jgi:N-acyl homoserine lactone hydrolase
MGLYLRKMGMFNTIFPEKGIMTYLLSHYAGGAQSVKGTNGTFLIEGTRDRIVIDAPGDPEIFQKHSVFRTEPIQTYESALSKVGLSPADVDILIMTHLHHDHWWSANKCKNAKIIVQKDELDFAHSPHPIMAAMYENPPDFELDNLDFETVKGDKEIVTGVKVLQTPGHTPGTQSVLIESDIGPVILGGFCSIQENFEPPEPISKRMSVLPPGIHINAAQAYDSALRLKQLAKRVIAIHEPNTPPRIP